jgi:hypothetical protein
MRQQESDWDNLLIDNAATAFPLEASRYQQWLTNHPVFISSTMDDQLNPFREAAKGYLTSHGGRPIMWETVTPRDLKPDQAYLAGVEASSIFVLLVGERYGVADVSGYSPTHQEVNRAEQLAKPRLLFKLPGQRDGRLNDWLQSMYAFLSGGAPVTPEQFVEMLDARLRDLAAEDQRHWIKLGRFIFPGRVRPKSHAQTGHTFHVTARVNSHQIRQQLHPLASSGQFMRLTWPNESHTVSVEEVSSTSEYEADEEVEMRCRLEHDTNQKTPFNFNNMSHEDQANIWCERSIFGKPQTKRDRSGLDMLGSLTRPDSLTLPEILQKNDATGWLALGLSRLYAIEGMAHRWGGSFHRLEVGPATAKAIPIRGSFRTSSSMSGSKEQGEIQGMVPLP